MAFDALRLRNIIQLFGILSMSRNPIIHYALTQDRYSIPPLPGGVRCFTDTPNQYSRDKNPKCRLCCQLRLRGKDYWHPRTCIV